MSFSNFQKRYYSTNKNYNVNQLTLWDKKLGMTSMFLNKRLTIIERNLIQLTPKVKSILIGIILSDGWMQKRNNWNPRMGFKQSTINFPYFWEIYSELGYLCSGLPMWAKHLKRGKFFFSLSLQTRQLDCLMEIYNLFYIKNKNLIIKTIKPELALYMDYIILAHWIMGDGSNRKGGLVLCTDNFSIQEITILVNILILTFDISPTIQKDKDKFRIFIGKKDKIKIKPHVLPFFVDHFLYKLN